MRRLSFLSAMLLSVAALPAQATATPHYKVTLLSNWNGNGVVPLGVNSAGKIVGYGVDPDVYGARAVAWDLNGNISALSPWYGLAWGVNEAGVAVGSAFNSPNCCTLPSAFFANGSVQYLPSPHGEYMLALNNVGSAAGSTFTYGSDGVPYEHAALYSDGAMHDLGAFGDRGTSRGEAINDSNQVAGYSSFTNTSGDTHAFLYDNGVMNDLGTLGGSSSSAWGINNAGTVVGTSEIGDAFYTAHAFVYSGGTMHELATLGQGDQVTAAAWQINNAGQIIGYSEISAHGDAHATLWQDDQLYDLNALLGPSGSGWTLQYADAISNNGYIVGTGLFNGVERAFLLTPGSVPEPASWALMLAGFGLVGGTLRKRRVPAAA